MLSNSCAPPPSKCFLRLSLKNTFGCFFPIGIPISEEGPKIHYSTETTTTTVELQAASSNANKLGNVNCNINNMMHANYSSKETASRVATPSNSQNSKAN